MKAMGPARAAGLVMAAWLAATVPALAETTGPVVVDDPSLDAAVARARAEFLEGKTFDRLDAAILIKQPDGTWKRGVHNPDALAYPASCIKLPYMVATMKWLREKGRPADDLDYCVGPMIKVSNNVQTGVVIDTITSTTNIEDLTTSSDERYAEWVRMREYPAEVMREYGVLGNQVMFHKTYPSNSGEWPAGAEKVAREELGMNMMSPAASAQLMLGIIEGTVEPWAREYMLGLLEHNRFRGSSVVGFGLPPGTDYRNKSGLAYDTLEDIAYAKLPNGREFIIAVFSNSFCRPYSRDPSPYNSSQLQGFMELLLKETGLDEGLAAAVIVDNRSEQFSVTGKWDSDTTGGDKFGEDYRKKAAGNGDAVAAWDLRVPDEGLYEVCIRHPQLDENAQDVRVKVVHRAGSTSTTLSQSRTGGRWIKLGDYELDAGAGRVEVSDWSSSSTAQVVADAVRAIRWPDDAQTTPTEADTPHPGE